MNKRDLLIVALLVILWISWPTIDRTIFKPLFPEQPVPEALEGEITGEAEQAETPETVAEDVPQAVEPVDQIPETEPEAPEETLVIEDDNLSVVVSSIGGGIKSATLKQYPVSMEDESPVELGFVPMPALAYSGLDGLGASRSFALQPLEEGNGVLLQRSSDAGLVLKRSITLAEDHVLTVTDEFVNTGAETVTLPNAHIQLGAMRDISDGMVMRGMVSLGFDTLSPGGEKVKYWGKKVRKFFEAEQEERGLAKLPVSIKRRPHEKPVEWIAAKNKYFVQILTPELGGEACRMIAERELDPREIEQPAYNPKMQPLKYITGDIQLSEVPLEPGEKFVRRFRYYVGPKQYSTLAEQGFHQVDVMEFGMWAPIGKLLLRGLIFIHDKLWPHSYGLAIILLTVVIRIIFWPITHKSTESMKRMAEIQPLATELREKYKDNPQRQQQELMALYKKHKVNPVGGCLPMLIQIPVFIALFVVLRSAIELRFSPFLWIQDLSQPENLFNGMIPIVGSLNILPLIMAGTMFWQQKLTPGAGDSQQQKMMAFMPVMMLVFFYKMPSGLVLYWTTNQCLMIAQQLVLKKKREAKAAQEE